jgi:hypothetical protein
VDVQGGDAAATGIRQAARQVEHGLRQDQAVGGDHQHVGLRRAQLRLGGDGGLAAPSSGSAMAASRLRCRAPAPVA